MNSSGHQTGLCESALTDLATSSAAMVNMPNSLRSALSPNVERVPVGPQRPSLLLSLISTVLSRKRILSRELDGLHLRGDSKGLLAIP